MKNLSIKSKIITLVFVGLVGILLSVSMTIMNSNQGKDSLNEFLNEAVIPSNKLKVLEENLNWTYSNMVEVTSDFSAPVASFDQMKMKFTQIDQNFNALTEDIFVQNNQLIQNIKKNWLLMKEVIEKKILPAYVDEDLEVVGEVAQVDISPFFFAIKKDFVKIDKSVKTYYNQIQQHATDALNQKLQISIVLSLICILLFLGIGYYIAVTQFIKPIKSFQNGLLSFFQYLNKETTTTSHLDENREDEFGQMAKVLNKNIIQIEENLHIDAALIEDTTKIANDVTKGVLTNRVTKTSNNIELNKLKEVINEMIDGIDNNVGNVLVTLDSYSNLDYTKNIEKGNVQAEIEKLFDGVNHLGEVVSDMFLQTCRDGISLQENSKKLLQNVDTLNSNSIQSAASLEETAAAIEEVNSSMEHNAKNIDKMTNYSKELSSAVSNGSNLANKTNNAMDEINQQVTSINEAITVIDQIAFQTNILSLNAAVEAATAGEAGKGFAVVAQEVRNLAARSAEAAKEIKEIVETATVKASDGKLIANEMIDGYTTINDNIKHTVDIMEDVTSSSKEQQIGISQINDAINQLDEKTQQNAQVANDTKDISIIVNQMAEDTVKESMNKEFLGKEKL